MRAALRPPPGVRPATPQSLFDRVAPYYDPLNSLLSLGQDRRWRRQAARQLRLPPGARVLDVATGTGSLARAVAALAPVGSTVIGCDLNARMLAVGAARVRRYPAVRLVRGAGESLPFRRQVFDAATIGFAIDDMADRRACANELFRVLKPGGQLVLLELSLPDQALIGMGYRAFLRLLDLVGRFPASGGFRHLRQEILGYRGRSATGRLLEQSGFTHLQLRPLSGGIATLHLARRPPAGGERRPAARTGLAPRSRVYLSGETGGLLDLATGQPRRVGPPPPVQEAIGRAARAPGTHHYYPVGGDPELRALVLGAQQRGSAFPPGADEVIITGGAIHALDALLRAHLDPGDEVLVPDPGFPPYQGLVRFSEGVPVPYRLRRTGPGFAIDLDDLESKIGARTRFLILNSPHNPTGHVLADDELRALAGILADHPSVSYISDEVYARLTYDRARHRSLAALSPAGVVVNSLSKSHAMQGYRIGWMYGARELVGNCRVVLENTVGGVSSIGQEAAKAALRAGTAELRASCRAARALAMEILDRCGVEYPVPLGGIYLFLPHQRGDTEMVEELAAVGVRVLPGGAFGAQGGGYLRATYTVPDEELVKGFDLIGQALAGGRPSR